MPIADHVGKLPKNYRLVYDIVRAQPVGVHADATSITIEAKRRQAGLGSSTVYRALSRLCASGLVHDVRVPGTSSALYEPARTAHAHFRCTACGAVDDIDYHVKPSDIAGLDRSHGITIADVSVTFHGWCALCRTAERSSAVHR